MSRSSMPRWFVLIVALLLPLQFAWSAGTVCRTGDAIRLVAAAQTPADSTSGEEQGACCADPDCASCHATILPLASFPLSIATVTPRAATPPQAPAPAFESAPARAPDRPQWLRLV